MSTSSSLGSVYNATKRADDPDTDDIDIYNLLIVDKNSFEGDLQFVTFIT